MEHTQYVGIINTKWNPHIMCLVKKIVGDGEIKRERFKYSIDYLNFKKIKHFLYD